MDLKFKDNSKLKLAPFTQLEYIKNTGTQVIDSGILTSTNLIIEFEASDFVNNKATMVVGARVANGNSSVMFQTGANINLGACIQYKSSEWSNDIIPLSEMVSSVKTKYTVVCDNNNMRVYKNDVYVTQITNTSTNFTPFSLAILGLNTNGTIRPTEGNCKLYSLKIKQNNIVVRNFIPVKDHDNEVCLYDTVSETLFYNQGTGDFIAGPEVPCTIISLPDNVLLKSTTLYHKNTPNVDGLKLLNNILNVQETAEDVVLNRIRVDIGNVSGSFSELMQYAGMAGFNDAGEEQAKPRLVGTWTINDWYTTDQLAQAQAAFDGLTIIPDSNYLIDFDDLAVQTLDSTKPNYNPAVAIILQSNSIGITLNGAVVNGGGRWFLSKSMVTAITDIGTWFKAKTTVLDTNGIVSEDTTVSYDFESFDEFQYFTGVNSIVADAFKTNSILTLTLPNSITSLGVRCFQSTSLTTLNMSKCVNLLRTPSGGLTTGTDGICYNDSKLSTVIFPPNIQVIDHGSFKLCRNLIITELPNSISTIGNNAFANTKINIQALPSSITSIGNNAFAQTQIERITIPIGCNCHPSAFNGCTTLKYIKFEESITEFTEGCFQGCSNLETLIFDTTTVTKIGYNAFYGCSSLIMDSLPVNLQRIERNSNGTNGAFYGCSSVTFTEMPQSLTFIGCNPFRYCSSIPYFHFTSQTPPSIRTDSFNGTSFFIYIGNGTSAADDNALLQTYLADTNWATYSSRLDTWYNYLHP